jgi:flagellar basal-body rod modification protein FlgD
MALPISGTTEKQPPSAAVPANPNGDVSGQDTFMKLLVAELQHQDPMDPVKNRDLVAQLATLTSVQKLSAIDEKLSGLQQGTLEGASLQSANLIGKTVTARTNSLTVNSLSVGAGGFALPKAAASVKVSVFDSAGQVIKTLDLGGQEAGNQAFQWDGKDINDRRVPNGKYRFQVTATDAAGASIASTSEVSGLVSEVSYSNGAPEVVVGNVHVGLSDLTSVAQ